MKYFIGVSVILFFCLSAYGQQVNVRGGFLDDSVGIGQQCRYYLAARYPATLNILFPDSTYTFQPFEFEKKQYYPTKTTDSLSYDSVVYYLSTFEVDAVQHLSLPVFVVNKTDSVLIPAGDDSIILSQLVKQVPDTLNIDKLPLKTETTYQKVFFLFNYPLYIIVFVAVLIVALIVSLVFGKRIKKYFRIKRLKKTHENFLESYSTHLHQLKENFSTSVTESALANWKSYMEQLEPNPYTKLTTREIWLVEKDETLGASLHQTDKSIYGHETNVVAPLENLRDYAEQKYLIKLEEVKHGK